MSLSKYFMNIVDKLILLQCKLRKSSPLTLKTPSARHSDPPPQTNYGTNRKIPFILSLHMSPSIARRDSNGPVSTGRN